MVHIHAPVCACVHGYVQMVNVSYVRWARNICLVSFCMYECVVNHVHVVRKDSCLHVMMRVLYCMLRVHMRMYTHTDLYACKFVAYA
jgi:hypothetical protein